jgi:putative ATP-dependent endonuclease of OLD family
MKITGVQIQRYRAFDKRTSIPISGMTVVTGPNNLGKSTVLSALEIFFSVVSPRQDRRVSRNTLYAFEKDYPKRYEGKSGRRWPTEILVTFELDAVEVESIKDAATETPPSVINVKVEFKWNDRVGAFRPAVEIANVSTDKLNIAIKDWLKNEVRYVYIPATRNMQDFGRGVFSELISGALSRVSRSKQRLQAIEKLFEDVKSEIAAVESELVDELRQYLPAVKGMHFAIEDWSLERLVTVGNVEIDDGANTLLQQKGDGFKSLFAISLLQYISKQRYGKNLIFGIEEPEAHLHSSAIYEIKSTLRDLATSFQVIITTHSPILIQRDDIPANVIVESIDGSEFSSTTRSAQNLSDIRRSLGIRAQENMTTAEVVLVVEGASEETALPSILGTLNSNLADAFSSGRARVLSAGSASNIPSVVRALARDAATCLVFVDSDNEGASAADKVRNSGLLQPADVFRVPARDGCTETEFEDLFNPSIYLPAVNDATGITISVEEFLSFQKKTGGKGSKFAKWSKVMASIANSQSINWATVENEAKTVVARSIAENPTSFSADELAWARAISIRIVKYLGEG